MPVSKLKTTMSRQHIKGLIRCFVMHVRMVGSIPAFLPREILPASPQATRNNVHPRQRSRHEGAVVTNMQPRPIDAAGPAVDLVPAYAPKMT